MVLEANRKNKEFEYMLKMYPRLFVTIRAKLKEIDEGRGGPLKTGDLSRLYEEREDGMHVLNIEKATEFLKVCMCICFRCTVPLMVFTFKVECKWNSL
tara:strand:- start:1357 stop:1650 length:294 start_codon:yes stop_codon:yes gene_type:complete